MTQENWGEAFQPFKNEVKSAKEFHRVTNVSHETLSKLEHYKALLEKWQKAINLIAPSTLPQMWQRHILDSAQLVQFIPSPDISMIDMGSGAGFPGLVLAILGIQDVHLIESDQRKCGFLKNVARELNLENVTVHNHRLEDVSNNLNQSADLITARALASLDTLVTYATPYLKSEGEMLFLKSKETDEGNSIKDSRFKIIEMHKSLTDPRGVILKIQKQL